MYNLHKYLNLSDVEKQENYSGTIAVYKPFLLLILLHTTYRELDLDKALLSVEHVCLENRIHPTHRGGLRRDSARVMAPGSVSASEFLLGNESLAFDGMKKKKQRAFLGDPAAWASVGGHQRTAELADNCRP